jgi:dienelactone hydrolase
LGSSHITQDPVWKHRKDKTDKTTDPGFDHAAWRDKHVSFARATVPKWTKAIADKYGKETTKYCCVGYCFGAPYVLNSLTADGFISAGAFAHPGALTDEQFQNLSKPLLLSCAENDHAFPPEKRQRAQKILQEGGKKYQFQLFQGVNHGFAVRCNLDDPYERYVKEQSYRGIVEWFNFWLSQ